MTDSLFTEEDSLPPIDPNKDYFTELVGDDKKYKDGRALAFKAMNADHHIANLEREKAELLEDFRKSREELNARAALQELIDQMKNTTTETPLTQQPPVDTKPMINPDELKSFFDERYDAKTREQKEAVNFNVVQEKLREAFGDNYQKSLKTQLNELGLSDSDAVMLAKKSPAAFFRQFGLDKPKQTETFDAPPQNSRRSDGFMPTGGTKRTWSYYQNLKKTNPVLYHDPKTQLQKDRDYQTLGKEFEDGDFNRRW